MKKLLSLLIFLLFATPALASADIICWAVQATPQNDFGFVGEQVNWHMTAATFTPSVTCTPTAVAAQLFVQLGSPVDTVEVAIYTDSAGSPGTKLASSTPITVSGASAAWATSTISGTGALTPGTTYWAVWGRTGVVNTTNYYGIAGKTTTNMGKRYASSWVNAGINFALTVQGTGAATTPTFNLWQFFFSVIETIDATSKSIYTA